MKLLTLEERDNLLVASLHRNEQNTIDDAFASELEGALAEAERLNVALLHLRSSTTHFCGGADPTNVARWLADGGDEALRTDGERWNRLSERIEQSPVIVFAEMKGNALGAGLGLALACDLRIAAASSRIGVPEVRVGLLPAGRTVERLASLGGTMAAQRLLLGGDLVDGAEAHRLGLVHWMAADDDLEAHADAIAQRVAGQSAIALREAKLLLAATRRKADPGAAMVEVGAFQRLINNEEPRARIKALLGRVASRRF